MIKITTKQVRKTIETPFFMDVNPEAHAAYVLYGQTSRYAQDFSVVLSEDKLTLTTTRSFESREALDNFRFGMSADLAQSHNVDRTLHNGLNGIATSQVIEGDS